MHVHFEGTIAGRGLLFESFNIMDRKAAFLIKIDSLSKDMLTEGIIFKPLIVSLSF